MSTATLSFLPSPVDLARQLAEADPGPDMIAMLGLLDPASLSPDDRLYVVQAWDRVCAWAAAQGQAAMAAFSGPAVDDAGAPGEGLELGRDELAAALRLGRGTAQTRMDQARVLLDRLPATLALLESGDISERHAREIAEACKDLSLEQAAAVEARVLPRAPELTVAELRPRLRRAVAAADPQAFEVAHARAAKQRRVVMWPEPDGMATVAATLPAADAKIVFLALDSLARVPAVDGCVTRAAAQDAGADVGGAGTRGVGTRGAGTRGIDAGGIDAGGIDAGGIDAGGIDARGIDAGGIDARRADALLALATAALDDPNLPQAHGRRVQVQVVMDPSTLLRFSEQPAELVGYGPIPASVARALAVDGMWQRLIVEPVTGHLLDYGETVYRPPQVLQDFLLARDVTCQFPGCRMPAYRSELDHIVPFGSAGGRTSASGMCALCKRHHQAKTKFGWQLERLDDGTLRWTSPEGRVYDVPQTDHRPDG